jgi:hypothetical protein
MIKKLKSTCINSDLKHETSSIEVKTEKKQNFKKI